MSEAKELWLWQYTDDFRKRRTTRFRLSEENARASLKDPVKVEGSLEIHTPIGSTSDFMKSRRKS